MQARTMATGKRTFSRCRNAAVSAITTGSSRKGVPEPLSQQFAFCLEPYLRFIYQYDAGNVQDVWPDAMEEFFMDWLMRKVMVKPPEYTQWPPALRLFYRFLSEKGYLDDPEPIIAGLQAIEPAFIAMVKQRS